MNPLDIGILAAQLAASAAAIAAAILIPPPFGLIISTALELTMSAIIASVESSQGDTLGAISAVAMGAISSIPIGGIAAKAGALASKVAPKAANTINKLAINLEKFTTKISKAIDSVAPDKLIEKAASKWSKAKEKTTKLQDQQLIMKKQMELETNGQVRTDKKINSTTFNSKKTSWVKCAHFEETKFIDRNNILGNLTIMYYENNDSRLGLRKNLDLNGNMALVAITIENARYKNDYVSGICRAKSWGSYYMRTWMTGKPGRGQEGINTAIFFGSEWRVDKRIKSLVNQYKNLDGVLENYAEKTAKKFIGKTKIGTKLMSYGDVYTKANKLTKGDASILKPVFQKYKKMKG